MHIMEGFTKMLENRNLSACSSNYISGNCSCYMPLWPSLSLVIIPWRYQHLISNLKAAADQPWRLLWGNGLFYNILLWLMRPFLSLHNHLFQVWDSLIAAFPSAQAPTIKVQLLCIYSQLQEINRTEYWAVNLSYVIWSFVFPFCMCVWSYHSTQDYSGSLHSSSQTEMIQQAISFSLPWAMLVWLQWTERHRSHC